MRRVYEMNRQLKADSGLSLADYDVLNALSGVPKECMQVTALAAQIGWERSRLSHHARRMERRGLVQCDLAASDRRGGEGELSSGGRRGDVCAAPRPPRPGPHAVFWGFAQRLGRAPRLRFDERFRV